MVLLQQDSAPIAQALCNVSGDATLGSTLTMWLAMLLGMMLPGLAPMLSLYSRLLMAKGSDAIAPMAAFVGAYLTIWSLFGLVASLLQLAIRQAEWIDARRLSPSWTGALLLLSGVYQFSSIKHACLSKCRSPLAFFIGGWRDGPSGGAIMGLQHGLHCLGCCWLMMLTMTAAGSMNLIWMALLSALMLAEKMAPWGVRLAQLSGITLIAAGGTLLALA